jgi:cell division protein FtsX
MSPLPLADVVTNDIPNVENATRYNTRSGVVKYGENVFNESVKHVDDNFLDFFDFQLIKGDKESLKDKSKILITEEMSIKYFGKEDPIGKTLILNPNKANERSYAVGAVLKNIPLNSSMRFNFLTHFDNQMDGEGRLLNKSNWGLFANVTFLELKDPSEAGEIAQRLNRYVEVQNAAREDWQIKSFHLDPLKDLAHNGHELRGNYLWNSLPPSAVWGPNLLAILLLITACLNFTNTTVSLSNRRLKEMGVRKVMGGTRGQIVGQLLCENLVICGLALLAAVVFVDFLLPPYNQMWEFLDIEANYLDNPPLLLFMFGAFIVAALLGGSYPAFYISAFNPINIFRGSVKFGGSNLFSRILLGVQVMISLSSVIVGIAFVQNSQFQKSTDVGYEYADVLVVPTFEEGTFETFRSTIEQNPKILASSGTRHQIDWYDARLDCQIQGEDFETFYYGIGENYFDVMDLEIVDGRFFDANRKLDYENALLINETFAKARQWETPLGQKITFDSVEHAVVGVIKDFYYEGFFDPIQPVMMKLVPSEIFNFWVVEAEPQNLLALNTEFKEKWNTLFPFKPYEGFFQSELMEEDLMVSNNIAAIMLFLAVITILLSSAGLFALVSLNILKRMKEIAIRKVVGASTGRIAWLINKNYVWIFLGAAIGGSVWGSVLANMLLSSIYATHVNVGILMLIFSSLMIFVIAGLTIGYKIMEVSKTNPSDILKSD